MTIFQTLQYDFTTKPLINQDFFAFFKTIKNDEIIVRDHEAASSSLATPTKKNPVISMVTGFFVFFGAARLASGSTKKVNKFGFFDKKTAQRQSLSGIFLLYFVVLHEIFFAAASLAVLKRCLSGKTRSVLRSGHSKSLESM